MLACCRQFLDAFYRLRVCCYSQLEMFDESGMVWVVWGFFLIGPKFDPTTEIGLIEVKIFVSSLGLIV